MLAYLVYVVQFTFIEAAKLESGVTINPLPTTEAEKICDDGKDNDNDGKIDANDQDCAIALSNPVVESCELQIVSGVPVNYGQLNVGQVSTEQKVVFKYVGNAPAKVLAKGGPWISDATGKPVMDAERTWVAIPTTIPWVILESYEFPLYEIGEIVEVYFQLKLAPGVSGSLHQEVTFDPICPTGDGLTRDGEILQEGERKVDNIDNNTIAKTPNAPGPMPIPYPDTNNTTKTQIRTD